MVIWNRDAKGLLPVREDYRLRNSASDSKGAVYKIVEAVDGSRQVWFVDQEGSRSLMKGPEGTSLQVRLDLVDVHGVGVHGAAMLVDDQGVPWGPVGSEAIRLPTGWRGFVLARGYASTPLHVRFPGDTRITLHPSAALGVTVSSEGLPLAGSRLFLRVFGGNVGPSPGRTLKLKGLRQVWIRGLQPGEFVNVELMSVLQRFDVVRAQVRLEKAVTELEMVARAFAEARLVTSDPGLVGQRLYVAPFYSNGPELGTLDFRYPWRVVEWDGSGWPLPRLRAGALDFWAWTEEGRFGRLGQKQVSAGARGVALTVHLEPAVTASLRVPGHALLHGRELEVIVFDASYVCHPENLLAMRKHMPGLRIKTWRIQSGQSLRMKGLWKRRSKVVVRSLQGASLWEGMLDLDKGSMAPLIAELAIGGLYRQGREAQRGQSLAWRVYSKKSGEVVGLPEDAKGVTKSLLLREGDYEVRELGGSGVTHVVHVAAGRLVGF